MNCLARQLASSSKLGSVIDSIGETCVNINSLFAWNPTFPIFSAVLNSISSSTFTAVLQVS